MPAGIQLFNPNTGALSVDYSDRIFKFLGQAYVGNSYTGTAASGVINNGFLNAYPNNVPFAFTISGDLVPDGYGCQYSFPGGGQLVWSFPGSDPGSPWTRPNTLISYGIY